MVTNNPGWRFFQVKYNLKYSGANLSLKLVDFISQA